MSNTRVVLLQAYDSSWSWEHRDPKGDTVVASIRKFRTLKECIDDAARSGYGMPASVEPMSGATG
jgi:hypothetical protein